MGGELHSPEDFPHGNLKRTSVAKKRPQKHAELGGGKKTRNSSAMLQNLKTKVLKNCHKNKNRKQVSRVFI